MLHRILSSSGPVALLLVAGCFPVPGSPDARQDAQTDGVVSTSGEWPPYGATTPANGGNPAGWFCGKLPVIDGKFTFDPAHPENHEWACAASATGLYGRLYVRFDTNRIYVLNDWRMRTDAPACPDMYNAFFLSTPGGLVVVRVFGDDRIEAYRNGTLLASAVGASGFGPSPNLATPHTIYEFSLPVDGMPDGSWFLSEHDPGNNATTFAAVTGGKCPPEAAPMIDEPMLFQLEVESAFGGRVASVTPADPEQLPLTGVEPWPLVPGQLAIVRGGGLSTGDGAEVQIGGQIADGVAWLGNCVICRVPELPAGMHEVVVRQGMRFSEPLSVQVQ